MQIQEFVNLAGEVVERLSPKIDAQQSEFVREDAEAGAWENALTNLVASLAKRDIAITRQDRDDLRRLIADLGEPTENVDRLRIEQAAREADRLAGSVDITTDDVLTAIEEMRQARQ